MAVDLQQILADSKECAGNVWWQAHDEKNFGRARENFLFTERMIAKYSNNEIRELNWQTAGDMFVEALKNYDKFTEFLKIDVVNINIVDEIKQKFEQFYGALGLNPKIATHSANWWIYFARARVADKKNDTHWYKEYHTVLVQNLADEHRKRYALNNDQAEGLASLMLAAMHLGHNTSPKNWEKIGQYMESYYYELFTILAERKEK